MGWGVLRSPQLREVAELQRTHPPLLPTPSPGEKAVLGDADGEGARTRPGRWEEPLSTGLWLLMQLIFQGPLECRCGGILHMGCLLDLLTGKWFAGVGRAGRLCTISGWGCGGGSGDVGGPRGAE